MRAMRRIAVVGLGMMFAAVAAAQVGVPAEPAKDAVAVPFHDKQSGVRFVVPAGWSFVQRDREVSTFHLDARSATPKAEMRGVAAIGFNPFPLSTFSGALFYYSVQRHTDDRACARQAFKFGEAQGEVETIGGMEFMHGHDEHGGMCVEQRDEVYTAFRKGTCYRFDLAVNTFCAKSSGASEMTVRQFDEIEARMEGILASVQWDFKPVVKANPNRRKLPAVSVREGAGVGR